MKLLKQLLETTAGGAIGASTIATVPSMGFVGGRMGKVKKRNIPGFKSMKKLGWKTIKEDMDQSEVMSKLKHNERLVKYEDSVGFALEDESGRIIKVYVPHDQAHDFERALADALKAMRDENEQQHKKEIAEVLYDLKDKFDIINIVWPKIDGDEEEEQEVGETGEEGPNEQEDVENNPEGGELEGGEEMPPEAPAEGSEGGVQSALLDVINMMKADAEARQAEAQAKKAEAEARLAEISTESATEVVKKAEQTLDMEDYYKEKVKQEKEAKLLTKLQKYKEELKAPDASELYGTPPTENTPEPKEMDKQPVEAEEENEEVKPIGLLQLVNLIRQSSAGSN